MTTEQYEILTKRFGRKLELANAGKSVQPPNKSEIGKLFEEIMNEKYPNCNCGGGRRNAFRRLAKSYYAHQLSQ